MPDSFPAADAALALVAQAALRWPGRVAVVSSFGADSAVLLHLVARADRTLPVFFLDTGQHFPETLAHRDALVRRLGLRDVRSIAPTASALRAADPNGNLHARDAEACCALRKVAPLDQVLIGFTAWLTGRRRHQAGSRNALPAEEALDGGQVRLNPLIDWSANDIAAYLAAHDLPRHPLVAEGYPSIGCAPCTSRVSPGEDPRAGRWRGQDKTECGIHFINGKLVRTNA
jgi:phosphoadenosine phosphosulfate reductase